MKQVLIAFLVICLPSFALASERKVVSLTSINYPPYFSEDLPYGGVMTDLIRAALKHSGMRLRVDFLDFPKALELAQFSSSHDGIYSVWYNQARAKWAYYSDPIIPNAMGFYRHRDSELSAYWNMTYLEASSKKIGVVSGYLNPIEVEQSNLEKLIVESDLQNLNALIKGEADLILIDKMVAESLIKVNYPQQENEFIWLDPPLEYKMQYLAIAKDAPFAKEKIDAFNQGLKYIKQHGMYQKIMKNHGFDWLLKDQTNWLHHIAQ